MRSLSWKLLKRRNCLRGASRSLLKHLPSKECVLRKFQSKPPARVNFWIEKTRLQSKTNSRGVCFLVKSFFTHPDSSAPPPFWKINDELFFFGKKNQKMVNLLLTSKFSFLFPKLSRIYQKIFTLVKQ